MKKIKEWLNRFTITRVAALLIRKNSALRQLGWINKTRFDYLEISGEKATPWFVYGAIDFINCVIPKTCRVLELGGGSSTKFWINRGNDVTTVETDLGWAEIIKSNFSNDDSRLKLSVVSKINPAELNKNVAGLFDVIVNDFSGDRDAVLEFILNSLAPGGWIIWDNSERLESQKSLAKLKDLGFGRISFFGLGPVNSYAWETSILSKGLPVFAGEK